MLRLVPLGESLVSAAADEVLAAASGADLSGVTLVSPSARFHHFLRLELAQRFKESFFPPRLLTVEAFISQLHDSHFPGRKAASEIEAVFLLFECCRDCYGPRLYATGDCGEDFARFYPRGRQLLAAVEEILTEGGDFSSLDRGTFTLFAELGDYHREFKDFIKGLPRLCARFLESLKEQHLSTRGSRTHLVAQLAAGGTLAIPPAEAWLFCGFHALNGCESRILRPFFHQAGARLLLHTDPASLGDPASPFHLQYQTIRALDLEPPATEGADPIWSSLPGRLFLHRASSREGEALALQRLVAHWAQEGANQEWTRTAVALPDPAALVPFVQNVVSRFDNGEHGLAFNITLGYPFDRTPLYQLLDAMLRVRENIRSGLVLASDYLSLVRHPYVKLSGSDSRGDSPLRSGIHFLEESIAAKHLVHFRLEELLASIEDAAVRAEVEGMHRLFLIPVQADLPETLAFMQRALHLLEQQRASTHLFFPEYLAAANRTLGELVDFCVDHPSACVRADPSSISALIRLFLGSSQIPFEGSPLKGLQVMGMLEFRGLCFARLAILDAVEGVLPAPRRYDPLLPHDIRQLLKMRSHTDWEMLFALHFFSLVAACGEVHLFIPEGDNRERSRFIERLVYEMEKGGAEPIEVSAAAPPYIPPPMELKSAAKDSAVLDKLHAISISPSSLETYLHCPLRFYLERIARLEEREDPTGEADAGHFGSIVHLALKEIYQQAAEPSPVRLQEIVAGSYRAHQFDPGQGLERVRHWVLLKKLQAFLAQDRRRLERQEIRILGLETEIRRPFHCTRADREVTITGRIDRIEQEGAALRVIDYKTGGAFTPTAAFSGSELKGLADMPEPEYREALKRFADSCRAFQVLLYLQLLAEERGKDTGELDAAYIFLKESERQYRPVFSRMGKPFPAEKKREIMVYFRSSLDELVADLLLRDAFLPNPLDDQYCSFCPFPALCGRS